MRRLLENTFNLFADLACGVCVYGQMPHARSLHMAHCIACAGFRFYDDLIMFPSAGLTLICGGKYDWFACLSAT